MGVKGLWRLLLPIGRRVSIEILEGKILAIDASIWLTQFLKAMRDPDTGSVKPAAHLIGFFRRLAKLRFHGIRPVLVFDGATPIIKLRELEQRRRRREQFAPNSTGAVQRLAKRLLIQEIKKAKLVTATGGSSTPGFNLPEDLEQQDIAKEEKEEDNEVVTEKVEPNLELSSTEIARVLQEEEWQKNAAMEEASSEVAVLPTSEEIARALQEEEWQENRLKKGDDNVPSDWDQSISAFDDEDMEKKRMTMKDELFDEQGFNVDYVASLDPHLRKDLIEDAKRQQRMRSRREFMPVAGQPAEYSHTQLRNFLRSSKLNRDIVKMAKKVTEKNTTDGVAMASDPMRRVIFEKFTKKATPQSSGLITRGKHGDESESEVEWEDVDVKKHTLANKSESQVGKEQTVALESSEEELHITKMTPARKDSPGVRLANDVPDHMVGRSTIVFADTSSDESSQGGFFKEKNQALVNEGNSKGTACKVDPDEDESCEGGFLKECQVAQPDDIQHLGEADNDHHEDDLPQDGDDEEEDEDDIEWEDGEGDAQPDSDNDDEDSDSFEKGDNTDTKQEAFDTKATMKHVAPIDVDSFSENRNVVALQEAQATAANLTNWAGRAFRRAIAEQKMFINKTPVAVNTKASPSQSQPPKISRDQIDDDSENEEKSVKLGDELVDVHENSIVTEDVAEMADLTSVGKSNPLKSTLGHKEILGVRNSTDIPKSSRPASPTVTEKLLAEEEELDRDHRRQERDMETVNDEMKSEIISLIQLFGIPFIESPAEAEAQCVALEELGLVDGVVTEDSDAFVFGGKTVYKNMFDDQKFVEVYKSDDAEKEMSLTRNEMVALAMLLGGDYTDGVKGVGIVNAMEILQAFEMKKSVKEGLDSFRKWLDGFDPSDANGSNPAEAEGVFGFQKFHIAHRSARTRWICPKHFPADNVLNAYLNPVVDKSTDPFSWGVPDVEKLVNFCSRNMGWEASDTRRMLEPISKRLESGMRQTRMDMFMNYSDNIQFATVWSKRLRSVLQDASEDSEEVGGERVKKKSRHKKR